MIADTENCYEIYKVLNDYNFNKISKEEARNLLERLDLKNVDTFKENVKRKIKEIMKRKKTSKVEKTIEVEDVVQEEKIEENITEEIIETVEEKSFEE